MRSPAIWATLSAVGLLGCKAAETTVQYGEPVGVQVGNLEIALAVTKGQAPEEVLEPLVGAIAPAVNACPKLLEHAEADEVLEIAFSVEQGKGKTRKHDGKSPGDCVLEQLDGKPIAVKASPLYVLAEVRTARRDGGAATR